MASANPPLGFQPRHPYSFSRFDPLNGTMPHFLVSHELDTIALRARHLLKQRTREQVFFTAASLNWMLEQAHREELTRLAKRIEHFERGADKTQQTTVAVGDDSDLLHYDTGLLLRYHPMFELDDQANLPEASWVDYFGVLALTQINAACEELHSRQTDERLNLNVDADQRALVIYLLAQHAIIAMETVSIAESFHRQALAASRAATSAEKKQREKTSIRMKRAALQRHAATNALKLECVEFWIRREERKAPRNSYNNAASLFLETIPEERIAHLKPHNRVEVLAKAIGQYVKEQRKLASTQ